MADLGAELRELPVAWPDTPDVAAAVAARIAAEADAAPAGRGAARRRPTLPRPRAASPRRGPRPRAAWRPAVAYGLAALAAAFALTMAASPDARSAVLEWLGLRSVRVERREPSAPPPRPGTLGSGLGLGTPVTLAEARARHPFLRLPAAEGLGAPDALYADGRGVALVYGARGGYARSPETGAALLVQELPARVGPLVMKAIGPDSRLERLRVDGAPAYFIAGSHGFAFEDDAGVSFEDERLAGNTLLVERADGLLVRVEGAITRDRAVAVARSIP